MMIIICHVLDVETYRPLPNCIGNSGPRVCIVRSHGPSTAKEIRWTWSMWSYEFNCSKIEDRNTIPHVQSTCLGHASFHSPVFPLSCKSTTMACPASCNYIRCKVAPMCPILPAYNAHCSQSLKLFCSKFCRHEFDRPMLMTANCKEIGTYRPPNNVS